MQGFIGGIVGALLTAAVIGYFTFATDKGVTVEFLGGVSKDKFEKLEGDFSNLKSSVDEIDDVGVPDITDQRVAELVSSTTLNSQKITALQNTQIDGKGLWCGISLRNRGTHPSLFGKIFDANQNGSNLTLPYSIPCLGFDPSVGCPVNYMQMTLTMTAAHADSISDQAVTCLKID